MTPLPRVTALAALVTCVVGAVMVLVGAWHVGVWTDDPAHVVRYANLDERGWYLLDDDFDGDRPGSWVADQYVYGPVTTELAHGVARVVGVDDAHELSTSMDAYAVRHTVIGMLGLVGVLAVALIARRLFGSWSWSTVAAASLLAIPMWPGLSMFDLKDIPAAVGYTLVTAALVELAFVRPSSRRRTVLPYATPAALLATGLVLAIGTRPGLWPGLAASLAAYCVLPWKLADGSPGTWRRRLVKVALAGVVAYGFLLLSYPELFMRPTDWMLGSIEGSADYSGNPIGRSVGSWGYVPGRLFVVMPPLLLIGGIAGIAGSLSSLLRAGPRLSPHVLGWLLVSSQALLLPMLAVARQSLLYDDLRQLLFACPAVALLLTAGWRRVLADVGKDSPTGGRIVGVLLAVALLVPLGVQAQMFPYGYSYAAPYASRLGANVENDWGRLSLRELVSHVPKDDFVMCYPVLSPGGDTMRYLPTTGRPSAELSSDCRTDPFSTLFPFDLAASDPAPFEVDDSFVALFTRGRQPGRNCVVLGEVTRHRYVSNVAMSVAARCDLVLNHYPTSGVAFDGVGTGSEFLLGGWTSRPDEVGVRMREPFGSLGVELPSTWADSALRVTVAGLADEVPEMTVNGASVPARAVDDGWELDVPVTTVEAMGERRLVVTVAQPTGESLVLTALRVDPLE